MGGRGGVLCDTSWLVWDRGGFLLGAGVVCLARVAHFSCGLGTRVVFVVLRCVVVYEVAGGLRKGEFGQRSPVFDREVEMKARVMCFGWSRAKCVK